MGTSLVVSVHDVAPASAEQTARWCADLDALGVPASLLVIPGEWRGQRLSEVPEVSHMLRERAARGDEIVLHGLIHTAGRQGPLIRRAVGQAVARGAAEFAALDTVEARRRIRAGLALLADAGLHTDGFCPPGWLASPGTVGALRAEGVGYLTVHRGLWDLRADAKVPGFALSHRPGGIGERLGATLMRACARRSVARGGDLVRIALHPDDLGRPGLREMTLRTIESVLSAGVRATTYGALIRAQEGTA